MTAVVSSLTGVIIAVLTAWLVWLQVIDRRRAVRPDPDSAGSTDSGDDESRPSHQAAPPLRVMVVDDHQFVREGISRVLREQGMSVVAEEASVPGAIDAADRFRPEVIVMDVKLSEGGSGIEATREILDRNPGIRVLMLAGYVDDDEALISSIVAGACGYVRKRIGTDELIAAIRAVGEGRSLIDPEMTGALLKRLRADQNVVAGLHRPFSVEASARSERPEQLSAQENRILSLIAKGLTNRRIMAELGLSENMVRNYVSSILGKLGINHRSDPAGHPDRADAGHDV